MTPQYLPQEDPLLFAFLAILDAAGYSAHLYAPKENNLTNQLSLLPPDNAPLPAFSYAPIVLQEIDQQSPHASQHIGKLLLTVEAALWTAKPDRTNDQTGVYFPWLEKLHQDTEHHTEGLDITAAYNLNTSLNLASGILRATIKALTQKTPFVHPITGDTSTKRTQESWLVEQYGLHIVTKPQIRFYKNVGSQQLHGAAATFQLIIKDYLSDHCKQCGFTIDTQQLSPYHMKRKFGLRQYTDPINPAS